MDLLEYVGAQSDEAEFAGECEAQAMALVSNHCGSRVAFVPQDILDRCMLEVGSELFHRRSAPSGIAQFAAPDGAPVRVARDPMVGAYPLLRPYIGMGIG